MSSRSINKAMIMGNMVRDPELRYTGKGTPICTFSVATNRTWSPSDSEQVHEDTEFHNVVAWSKLAELCAELLYKGRRVYIEGRLQTRDWVDEESGKKMYRTEIVAEEMIALGPPKGVSDNSSEEAVGASSNEATVEASSGENEVQLREGDSDQGEDIPF